MAARARVCQNHAAHTIGEQGEASGYNRRLHARSDARKLSLTAALRFSCRRTAGGQGDLARAHAATGQVEAQRDVLAAAGPLWAVVGLRR